MSDDIYIAKDPAAAAGAGGAALRAGEFVCSRSQCLDAWTCLLCVCVCVCVCVRVCTSVCLSVSIYISERSHHNVIQCLLHASTTIHGMEYGSHRMCDWCDCVAPRASRSPRLSQPLRPPPPTPRQTQIPQAQISPIRKGNTQFALKKRRSVPHFKKLNKPFR